MRDMEVDQDWALLATPQGAQLAVDLGLGNIRRLELVDGERILVPLHHAPWLDEPEVQANDTLPPVERNLSGDFFCAPFGASDLDDAPTHGWPANSAWDLAESDGTSHRMLLRRPVMGARIEKRQRLAPDAPLLYQIHTIEGGTGDLTVAHHPMVRLAGTGRFFTSPKAAALTPDTPLEPGRARLACPAQHVDLATFPGADGRPVDLTDLPIGQRHEDFVTLVEAAEVPLGWSAVMREVEDDIVFILKDPATLPVTMLWHSNGGRDYAPWNGRHRGVLGIEDGCAAGAGGHRAALAPNPVAAMGVPTALPLAPERTHRIGHVIGAIAQPPGWTRIDAIRIENMELVLIGDAGDRRLPFDPTVFGKEN
ncbi:MAG: hypothetical protein AAGF30_04110 [Pseudomonadota bacterium]